ncbi:MAG: hypothetical protein Q7S04_00440 [Candidatus Moranbacteria bacterium]|nr:hypothetical protein [Candidatus Moranbacteria bacterium]
MTIPFPPIFKKLLGNSSLRGAIFFWYRRYKVVFFFGFLIVLSIGGWNWYQSLYQYHFSDDEKKQYIDSYFRETTFKETQFRETIGDLKARALLHEKWLPLTRNIFEGKGIQPRK